MSAQFGERYRTKATIRIQYKPGDAIQMDWAGDAILIQDPATGEQSTAYLQSDSPGSKAIMDGIIHNAYEALVDGRVSMRERRGLKGINQRSLWPKMATAQIDSPAGGIPDGPAP